MHEKLFWGGGRVYAGEEARNNESRTVRGRITSRGSDRVRMWPNPIREIFEHHLTRPG